MDRSASLFILYQFMKNGFQDRFFIFCLLSVDDISVFVLIFIQTLFVGVHGAETHTDRREATIVEEVLHGHFLCQVREHDATIVSALVS